MSALIDELTTRTDLDIVREALRDEYEVKAEIGRGGMGIVFRGVERGLNREVALKVLPLTHVHDASVVERFQNEARTAARLEHANIIPIYRVGRSGTVIYFSMRYLRGPSLGELIEQVGPIEPRELRRILIESARALGHGHERDVIHRDVKPDNILFKQSGEVVMCDFGIAKAAAGSHLTGTGMAIGTPYYMSPEQFRAQPLDGRSDLYSLGVVAYQCLTKRVPFDGEDSFAIGYKHVTEEVSAPDLKTTEQRELFEIIKRMMAKDRDHRFPDAQSVVAALSGGGGGVVIEAPIHRRTTRADVVSPEVDAPAAPVVGPSATATTVTHPEIAHPPKKRRRRRWLKAAVLLLGLTGGTGGGALYYAEVTGRPVPYVDRLPWASLDRVTSSWIERLPYLSALLPESSHATPVTTPTIPADSLSEAVGGAVAVTKDSAASADSVLGLALDSGMASDSVPASDSLLVADSSVIRDSLSADSTAAVDSVLVPLEPAEPVPGHLIVSNMGRNGRLWIDGVEVRGLRHDLPEGAHHLRVESPGYEKYTTTVTVGAADTLRHRVRMARISQCQRFEESSYNLRGECFDVRARPGRQLSTLVPLDSRVRVKPVKPAILVVQVYPDGTPGTIIVKATSDVPEFALLAIEFAKQLTYEAATKGGRPVMGWVQLPFYAQ